MDDGASETDVARAVFEADAPAFAPMPAITTDRIAAAEAEAQLAADRRRVERKVVCTAGRCWSARHPGPLVLVHKLTMRNTAGIPVGDISLAHRVQPKDFTLNRREWRRLIERVDAAIQPLVSGTAIASSPRATIVARIAKIRERLRRQRATEVQRSLFDGRMDAEAGERERVIASLDASLARTAAAIASPVDVAATGVELIAAWSEHRR